MTPLQTKCFIALCHQNGIEVEAEYRFHPTRKWRFDFAIPALKLAIEAEGGVWTNGRHTRGAGYIGDLQKYNEAALFGWSVYRFTVPDLCTVSTIRFLKKAIEVKQNGQGF